MSAAGHDGLSPRALSRTHVGKPICYKISIMAVVSGKYIFPLARAVVNL